ncbi:hypothetical protein [Halegenticoccus tardaugens]|uniref:hypothetical protein n=1 Tax=Halegenticoccus tardaugens TaxID=2071624 RepID=UPI00100BB1C9|nr:hypothetical protein [Halegenticoccus tardaugens]
METDTQIEDEIARAMLSESPYERLRMRRFSYFKQSIPRKLAWQSGLLVLLALVLPIAATLPPAVKASFSGGSVLAASPKIALLGAFAAVIEIGTAGCLGGVALRRLRLEPTLTERQARTLLNLEDVASMVGLVTGGFAVLLTNAFFLLGHGGAATVAAYVDAGGQNPFGSSEVGVSVAGVSIVAAVAAVVVYGGSRYLAGRLCDLPR